MTTVEKPGYNVIGTRPVRPDGVEKVTGKAQYGADIRLPNMIFGKVLRSPHAHARILSLDTSAAEAYPGVLAVITHRDLPTAEDKMEELGESAINVKEASDNVLASDKALYRGHAIAAVAAANPHVAEEALAKIKVEYEVLPPVLDVRDAMREDAPLLSETRHTKSMRGGKSDKPSNIAATNTFKGGDVDAAFEEADAIVEREFTTKMVHQGYIEPQVSTASWNADGTITIWTSTQGSFAVRALTAELLRHPVSNIRVIPMEIGGGFGGKLPIYLDPVAALLSKKSGRPVKVQMSRTDVFEGTGPTSGSYIKVKMGVKGDRITAVKAMLAYEAGAYPGSSVGAGAMCMLSPYNVENFEIDTYDVVVNKPKTAAYRAPGAPAAGFATESVVDELCRKLNIDPLEFRKKNASHQDTRNVMGVPFPRIGNEETLDAAINSPHYKSPIEGPNRGRGVASGFWFNGGMQSSVVAAVNPDGTVNLIEGSTDIGGTRASLAMQLAETLGIPFEAVRPSVVDTDSIGHNDVTGGSRTTFASGMAVFEAGMDIRAPDDHPRREALGLQRRRRRIRRRQAHLQGRLHEGAHLQGDGRAAATHGRPDRRQGLARRARRRWRLRHPHRRRRGRPGDRQGHHPPLHRRPGRRHRDSPGLRRGPDPGRRRPGHRLGAQRGVLLRRQRSHGELELPRLPHADGARRAHHRHHHRRGAQPRAPVRRARRR